MKNYTLQEYKEFSMALMRSIENEDAFSKIYDKLEDIVLSISVLKTEYKERNNKEFKERKARYTNEYNIDDLESYFKVPTKFVSDMKKMCADDDNTVRFCEMVLRSIEFVKSMSNMLKGITNIK